MKSSAMTMVASMGERVPKPLRSRAVTGVFDALAREGHPGDSRGAAFLRAGAETRPGTVAHRKIAEHREGILEWITALAGRAGVDEPDQLARTLELILEGGQASELTSRCPEAGRLARAAAREVIRSAISRTKPTQVNVGAAVSVA